MPEPLESGWHRLGAHGWEPVDASDAAEEIMAGGGWDLVYVDVEPAAEEIPLF